MSNDTWSILPRSELRGPPKMYIGYSTESYVSTGLDRETRCSVEYLVVTLDTKLMFQDHIPSAANELTDKEYQRTCRDAPVRLRDMGRRFRLRVLQAKDGVMIEKEEFRIASAQGTASEPAVLVVVIPTVLFARKQCGNSHRGRRTCHEYWLIRELRKHLGGATTRGHKFICATVPQWQILNATCLRLVRLKAQCSYGDAEHYDPNHTFFFYRGRENKIRAAENQKNLAESNTAPFLPERRSDTIWDIRWMNSLTFLRNIKETEMNCGTFFLAWKASNTDTLGKLRRKAGASIEKGKAPTAMVERSGDLVPSDTKAEKNMACSSVVIH
ncbi:hypothetical protein J6590_064769 [Homalodisca vitripennis]|nr:hypothetical protein J6590_064769 [Homalodisca vitripennis]